MRFSLCLLTSRNLKFQSFTPDQTRRRLGGRQPLCGIGVTSLMCTMCKPGRSQRAHGGLASRARALHAHFDRFHAVLVARHAGGGHRGLLRGVGRALARSLEADRSGRRPATRCGHPAPQMVTIVLLNVAWMWATPCGTTRFSRFFLNSFLRFDVFAGACVGVCCLFFCQVSTLASNCRFSAQLAVRLAIRLAAYFRAATFFLAATAPLRGPLRVRALVCVRWPRTGRLRRWRMPR